MIGKSTAPVLLSILSVSHSFAPFLKRPNRSSSAVGRQRAESLSPSCLTPLAVAVGNDIDIDDGGWTEWAAENGVVAPKLSIRSPLEEERGKGGVNAAEPIAAIEVLARIPRSLVLSGFDAPPRAIEASAAARDLSWATELTAAAVAALHPSSAKLEGSEGEFADAKRRWVGGWESGGWGTNGADLGPPEADWGSKCVTGSLLATGSDNDHNIYAKFRFPCHPVVHRAALGLALLTGADEGDSLSALRCRGEAYRAMRDALLTLVGTPTERKGSMRERRCWDVADTLSKVLSRATTIRLDEDVLTHAVVPLHERLSHCDSKGTNTKLIADGDEILLVATRDIAVGEAITRNYSEAPQLDGDISEGALRLLLQFGLPPSAWPQSD